MIPLLKLHCKHREIEVNNDEMVRVLFASTNIATVKD
jgi:hypothetical protein